MIVGFADKHTEALYRGSVPKRFPADVRRRMIQKLQILNAAVRLDDLRVPSGNRLEALVGNRAGYHSMRINDQWRIFFRWMSDGPNDVEITAYH